MSVVIDIPALPPSPNRTRRNTHWTARAAIDADWRKYAYFAVIAAGANGPQWTKVRLSVHFYLPDKRRRDMPNLVGSEGMKGLIDGLVDARVMADDSLAVLAEYGPFTWELRKDRPGVRVTVEPIE